MMDTERVLRDVDAWRGLISEYGRLRRQEGHTVQSRGQRFNGLIAELFRCWGIDASPSIRTTGEIDVAFSYAGTRYVLEAKWEKEKSDTGHIAKLQKRVRQRLAGTYGMFLSMSGYTTNALADIADGERLEILLLDRSHWEAMLSGLVPPEELLTLMHDRASFYGEAYTPLSKLLTPTSAIPNISFGPPEYMINGALRSADNNVTAEVVLSDIDSDQIGISCRGENLLITTTHGIIAVDTTARTAKPAAPVSHCHRNTLPLPDGSILFTRRQGVGRYFQGEVTALGGGLPGNSCVLSRPDGSIWAFDNGEYSQSVAPSVTQIGSATGDEIRHQIPYPPSSAFTAAWISNTNFVTIGNPNFTISSVTSDRVDHHPAPQSNPMGIVHIGNGVILTAGDSVAIGRTDTCTWTYQELARVSVAPSVNELAISQDGDLYIAAYQESQDARLRWAVIKLLLPRDLLQSRSKSMSTEPHPDWPNEADSTSRVINRDKESDPQSPTVNGASNTATDIDGSIVQANRIAGGIHYHYENHYYLHPDWIQHLPSK